MSWAKFDDRTPSNPKVQLLSDAAFRLWFSSVCHCCEHLTDGAIGKEIPGILPKAPSGIRLRRAIQELVDRGLWDETAAGWLVHDFLEWNPTAQKVRAKKQARSEAGRRGGKKSGQTRSKREAIASAKTKQTGSKNEPRPRPRTHIPPVVPHGGPAEADAPKSIQDRCAKLQASPYDAQFVDPRQWPEFVEAAGIVSTGLGFGPAPKLGGMSDPGVKQLVSVLAAGFTIDEIRQAAPKLREHDFLKTQPKLQKVTPSILREVLDGGDTTEAATVVSP